MIYKLATDQFFKSLDRLEYGALTLETPDGKVHEFVGSNDPHERATFRLKDWRVIANMIRGGDIALAEDYRDGKWDTEDLTQLLKLGLVNRSALDRLVTGGTMSRLSAMISYLFKINSVRGSKRNIHAHYDLGNDFYKLWLDPSMTYSSALYHDGAEQDLQRGQYNKYDRILNQLDGASGDLLEIGCGWGGFAERAIGHGDFSYKGLTISNAQHAYATQRIGGSGHVALQDYRHEAGLYEHIVSIEMFEAVGERYWPTYFKTIAQRLKKGGKAVIQTIAINDRDFPRYRKGGDFIRSYIFPGGMLPSPSRFDEEAAKAGLKAQNHFAFGQDYARTLLQWLDRFDAQKDTVKAMGFDDNFIRLWRFYLAACSAGFQTGRTDVYHVELTHA